MYSPTKLSSTNSKKFSLTLPIYVQNHESVKLDPKKHFAYVEFISQGKSHEDASLYQQPNSRLVQSDRMENTAPSYFWSFQINED